MSECGRRTGHTHTNAGTCTNTNKNMLYCTVHEYALKTYMKYIEMQPHIAHKAYKSPLTSVKFLSLHYEMYVSCQYWPIQTKSSRLKLNFENNHCIIKGEKLLSVLNWFLCRFLAWAYQFLQGFCQI